MDCDTMTAEIERLATVPSGPLGALLARDQRDDVVDDIVLGWGDALGRLEHLAIRLETAPEDDAALGGVRRTLHSLKGDAGILGLAEVTDVLHRSETLLEVHVDGGCCPTDMLLKVADWLQQLLDAAARKAPADPDAAGPVPGPPAADAARGGGQTACGGEKTALKTLIVEDDFTSRLLLQELLRGYGPAHVAVNGLEAVAAVTAALDAGEGYDLVCLDIMMPEMDGHSALKRIRALEESRGLLSSRGAKVVMTTALGDLRNVSAAYQSLCDGYLVKPIEKARLLKTLRGLKLIP